MGSFGHSVREIERSHEHVVIEETATTGAVWLFGGIALLVLVFWLTSPRASELSLSGEAAGVCALMFFAFLALWASVRSTYSADRRSGQLVIERTILFQTFRTAYDAHTIDRVYVRHTTKGSGLYLQLKSGRKKRLSVSFAFGSIDPFAMALNTALHTHRES
jgi:hypothetical protein